MKGGSDLTQENQSYLRFSLEESVWFQKGQEVEELYSISLDPNVTLTEDDHYVYIRGTLDLSGEYANSEENEEAEDYANVFLPKSVQSVERNSDGMYEFMHRFPVDITIPSSRIASLDDIEVSIHTFDYTIPERNSLKLQADLMISGIYSENHEEPAENEEDSLIVVDARVEKAEDEAVEIEISDVLSQLEKLMGKTEEPEKETINHRIEATESDKKEEDKEVIAQTPSFEIDETPPVKNAAAPPTIPDFQPALRDSKENEGELYEPFTVEAKRKPEMEEEKKEKEPVYVSEKKDIPQFEIPVSNVQEEDQVQPITREEEPLPVAKEENEREVEPLLVVKEEESEQEVEPIAADTKAKEREEINLLHVVQKPRRPVPRVEENREQKQEAKQKDQTEPKEKTGESLSIADFFSRKQEEEHVRVKVCIVQKGETLDDLAERYEISVQTILQSNELQSNQDIHEGQVLYIRQSQIFKNS